MTVEMEFCIALISSIFYYTHTLMPASRASMLPAIVTAWPSGCLFKPETNQAICFLQVAVLVGNCLKIIEISPWFMLMEKERYFDFKGIISLKFSG